jgi:hypothetical protein
MLQVVSKNPGGDPIVSSHQQFQGKEELRKGIKRFSINELKQMNIDEVN